VPFHVEIRRSFRHARAFNLNEHELRDRVLLPWVHGAAVQLGDREWDPAEAELQILEGPELDSPALAMGQGWGNAERSGEDVTARVLVAARQPVAPTGVAVLAQTPEAQEAATAALAALGVPAHGWGELRALLLGEAAGAERGAAAPVALVAFDLRTHSPAGEASWWLDVGLALGALRERAVRARIGEGPLPASLGTREAVPLDAAEPQALAERLRLAGLLL
jgi:hypothetical protein